MGEERFPFWPVLVRLAPLAAVSAASVLVRVLPSHLPSLFGLRRDRDSRRAAEPASFVAVVRTSLESSAQPLVGVGEAEAVEVLVVALLYTAFPWVHGFFGEPQHTRPERRQPAHDILVIRLRKRRWCLLLLQPIS